ncbi:MAG: sigma-70 family RNA polymerase sigma factor [Bacteroidota bacterium]|nr:sigma-70 family RNA polymerase sigma factor [Bacteroidota bacterium]
MDPQAPPTTQAENPRQATDTAGDLSDDFLVMKFQAGDRNAFRILFDRYRERVRNVVYNILHDVSALDDMAQEIFLRVYDGLSNFRFDSAFSTWLYRIAVNRCRDEIRKRRIRRVFSLQAIMESGNGKMLSSLASCPPGEPDIGDAIREALARLPDRYRIPVVLRDIEGFRYEEIAQITQTETGTVKSRIARGRAILRTLLSPYRDGRPLSSRKERKDGTMNDETIA